MLRLELDTNENRHTLASIYRIVRVLQSKGDDRRLELHAEKYWFTRSWTLNKARTDMMIHISSSRKF